MCSSQEQQYQTKDQGAKKNVSQHKMHHPPVLWKREEGKTESRDTGRGGDGVMKRLWESDVGSGGRTRGSGGRE